MNNQSPTPGPSPGTVSRYPWNDAPEWAMYAATDQNGHAHFFDARPVNDSIDDEWMLAELTRGERYVLIPDRKFPAADWRDSLEARPRPSEGVPDAVRGALSDVQTLVEYAYAQGFHELGYDPVQTLRNYLRPLMGEGETP